MFYLTTYIIKDKIISKKQSSLDDIAQIINFYLTSDII